MSATQSRPGSSLRRPTRTIRSRSCSEPVRTRSLHALQEAVRIEGEAGPLHIGIRCEVAPGVDDVLDCLCRTGAEAGPDRVAAHDRLFHDDVGAEGYERRVQGELRDHSLT